MQSEYDGFSRFKPSRGNDPDSDYYLGKLMPGFRSAAAGPAPFEAPDLEKLEWKMVRGAKEFQLVAMPEAREFLPGHKMNVYGYNGSMPGPTIEVTQGDRVRIRIMNFAPMQHHSIHLHGHTFWLTGREGARTPKSAWLPRNTELIGIAQATDFEFIANNPGDWMFHCHMVHHMMNHMTRQVGPRIRPDDSVESYLANTTSRPQISPTLNDPGFSTPGYPQEMNSMSMPDSMMKAV